MEELNTLSQQILNASFTVHSTLGPGLLESVYEECLFFKLKQMGLFVEKQRAIPVVFEDVKLEAGFRADLVVENKIIVEIKSVENLADIHTAQTLTYLKLGGYKLGLLINFNVVSLKLGIKRLIK